MNNKFIEYREMYKDFIFNSYSITDLEDKIEIKYDFEIPNLSKFGPKLIIQKKDIQFKSVDDDFAKYIAFNLGMVELVSYWKCVCPKNVIIKCGYLDEYQINWFKKLYYFGLGEYRYRNNIEVSQEELMDIKIESKEVKYHIPEFNGIGSIIPVGGGKDSTVTLELLNKQKENNYCLTIGSKEPSMKCIEIAGYDNNKIIEVNRIIDENIKRLNQEGFLNGHTPFSAMVAFLSYLIAYLTDRKYIALSNESSANESNVNGENINHQYSKSYEFEQDFQNYVEKYFTNKIQYFSMLRPICELQIAMLFAKIPQYHKVFRSCNVGSKQTPWKWCCNCAKCLFVYCILSPFLYKEQIIEIFGEDLFEKEELLNTFIELCGFGEIKPFECVGTYEEINFAISKTINKLEKENKKLPFMLEYYKNNYNIDLTREYLLTGYSSENSLPEEFAEILKSKLKEAIC